MTCWSVVTVQFPFCSRSTFSCNCAIAWLIFVSPSWSFLFSFYDPQWFSSVVSPCSWLMLNLDRVLHCLCVIHEHATSGNLWRTAKASDTTLGTLKRRQRHSGEPPETPWNGDSGTAAKHQRLRIVINNDAGASNLEQQWRLNLWSRKWWCFSVRSVGIPVLLPAFYKIFVIFFFGGGRGHKLLSGT